jgi:glycosyltransferase involved in cell wall biosynthesis
VAGNEGTRAPVLTPPAPTIREARETGPVARSVSLSAEPLDAVVLVPARDEQGSVGAVVRALLELPAPLRVVVIDDGSRDDTASKARAAGAEVICHERPRGNGAAIKSGLRATREPWVVIVDGDGQHDPAAVPLLLAELADGADLAVGARPDFADSGLSRAAGNHVLGAWASYMTGAGVPDLTSGLRAFRRDRLEPHVPLLPEGFSTPTTSTLALLHEGRDVRFLPVPARRRRRGRTHTRLLDDGARFVVIALRVSRLFRPWRARLPWLVGCGVALLVGFMGAWPVVLLALLAPVLVVLAVGARRARIVRRRWGVAR